MHGAFKVYPDGEFSCFAPGCLDSQIGKTIPFKKDGGEIIGQATIVGVNGPSDGEYITMTFETDSEEVKKLLQGRQYKGLGPRVI